MRGVAPWLGAELPLVCDPESVTDRLTDKAAYDDDVRRLYMWDAAWKGRVYACAEALAALPSFDRPASSGADDGSDNQNTRPFMRASPPLGVTETHVKRRAGSRGPYEKRAKGRTLNRMSAAN